MNRIPRKTAISVEKALKAYLRQAHLTPGLNTQRVFAAWDEASGAGSVTVRKFFRDGKLYITVGSSVIRSQLLFQKQGLIEKMNDILSRDMLFDREDTTVGFVKELILK